ncbi:filamentous hemagglutinin [Escherichia coli]|nr:filamentous hemagglutinin N-terminal domain-containing protein [Escherichia coli]EFI6331111.1 filamentous hemagglutinin N-terminal domain-containing protein [Escherichia coli]EGE1248147.1 filamentous hemagglutinin [Escherichia coli]EJO0679558.1 filamentous hemagglutinin N-terminal domain-containing protein [Escherichia coli]
MNHIYKLKFDKRRNALVVVSEITPGTGRTKATGSVEKVNGPRRGIRSLTLSLLSGMIMMAHPVMAAGLPTGGQIVAGSGSIQTPSGSQMNIYQNSQNMVASWNSFDIGKGNTVQFYQPDSSAVALNRVVGGGESQIMGNLKANGQVFLVNPNGVLFGKDSVVSTAGFVASTRDISNDDFMNRRYTFSGSAEQGAEIVSQGSLTTNAGGYIVLAADKVRNSGTISTPGGKTVLAAAESVTLQLDNGGLTSVQVSGDVVNALVENRGLVSARNGQVWLTAHGRDMLMNTVLNVSGVVEADGMHRQDGNIVLDGGDSGVVHLSATLHANNAAGSGGKVVVEGKNLLLGKGSSISATGSQGGGEVYVGGGWQGKNSHIKNADRVVMQEGSHIDVSATQQGDGGTAVLWSESFTDFRGQINAKGGETGGNGGQVETSSHGNLQAFGSVSASANKGRAGKWLLDPQDITIVNGDNNKDVNTSTTDSTTLFTPSGVGSQVSNTSINNELNKGTSVTILTNSTVAGSQQSGNITVNAAISKSHGGDASLTLKADGNITVNKNITSTQGKLNITLQGAGSNTGRILLNNVTLNSNGGDITLGRMDGGDANALTVNVTNSTLTASNNSGGGNITISAWNPNVNLSVKDYSTTVRNGNTLIWVSNSSLSGGNVTLTGTQNGTNASQFPVYLNGANITSTTGDISLTGNGSGSNAAQLELRGCNTLTSYANIYINSTTAGHGSAVRLNGTNNTLTANGSINLYGKSANKLPTTVDYYGSVLISGNANLSAPQVNISGIDSSGQGSGVGFYGANLTLGGDASISGNGGVGVLFAASVNITSQHDISINGNGTAGSTLYTKRGGILFQQNAWAPGNTTISAKSINMTGYSSGSNASGVEGDIYSYNNQVRTNVTLNATDISINGTSDTGDGVRFLYLTIITENAEINGTSKGSRSGVQIAGNLTNTTINGESISGYGVTVAKTKPWNGGLNQGSLVGNGNTSINGISNTGNGVYIFGDVDGLDSINGSSVNGTGVNISGNSSLINTTVIGASVNGSGVNISGNLGNSGNSTIIGASVNGTGVNISANITNGTITGSATGNGTGVNISGNSSLINTTVIGAGVNGSGVNISGNLGNSGNSTITGNASGNGTGVNISANITNGTITGNATGNGPGVNISGNSRLINTTVVNISANITNGTITGNATGNGSGVNISGNSSLSNTTLSGHSVRSEDVKARQKYQLNQAATGALRAEEGDIPATSGYRSAPQTVSVSVCDENKDCSHSEPLQAQKNDGHPPYRHTGVVGSPLSTGGDKGR